ncbi:glycerate kinase [Pseudonocardia eucalypti]|uniref:glycerate kinase n=1 Tax=Pseudonocardia eucalypti TaxID=648755 RepID=UPI00161CA0C7|nr:glycerate kinase [Pseudonocardia eucalypti]
MRVVIAPDSFGGTLSAKQAAAAIADGWRGTCPTDELRELPLADGGTGFLDVLHAALGGELCPVPVTGPRGEPVTAEWLRVGEVAYIEMALASGLHMVPRPERTPEVARVANSRGVGQLVAAAAAETGVTRIVVGLGGSACTDGGAGALAALGAQPLDADGAPLPDGGAALAGCAALAAPPALRAGLELVLALDVDNPLLGRHGAAAVFGPQKGADDAAVAELDAALRRYAEVLAPAVHRDAAELVELPGGGAAGGLGAALLALGGRPVSGAGLVRELLGLDAALDAADLVLTGEGSFDWQSLRGKLITAVAASAAARGLPCLVLAGQVSVGRREAAAAGVQEAYSVTEHAGGLAASMADPAGTLAKLAADLAGQWSGSR